MRSEVMAEVLLKIESTSTCGIFYVCKAAM